MAPALATKLPLTTWKLMGTTAPILLLLVPTARQMSAFVSHEMSLSVFVPVTDKAVCVIGMPSGLGVATTTVPVEELCPTATQTNALKQEIPERFSVPAIGSAG
jgi:hypothetical protein